ncbi:wsc domain-containing [Trichoderma arundinaceum]|uniref:Peroxidase n=1 Tax=Trichoderma arundinaceum TaxID=490622 RepID=A0A395NHZ6_TRIAR|nr:wsc domain-containing [Trichoderma arundinaceum]
MATADIFAGTGGLDASIIFDLDRPENVGTAFQETLHFMLLHYNSQVTMADLFALATVEAVGSCSNGNIIMPFRAGRVDAVGPGPSGVPEPQQDLETHTKIFAKQGSNTSEMIALVACGHSIGGISDDNTVSFDTSTDTFDNPVLYLLEDTRAKEFVANTSQNPLAFGQNETTRSDFRILNADGGDMISQMASSEDFFSNTCNTMLEPKHGVSSFIVKITDTTTGKVAVYNNRGAGFPLSDAILPVHSLSSQGRATIDGIDHIRLNLTAAVLNAEQFTNVSLNVPQPLNKGAAISPWVSETVHEALEEDRRDWFYALHGHLDKQWN